MNSIKNRTKRFIARVALLLGVMVGVVAPISAAVISGRVTDTKNQPFIGASVLVKGTTRGITTDFNGEYKLEVPAKATLVFSYIGYVTKEVTVGNQTKVDVSLDIDNTEIDEVVVVGYGELRKSDISGSVSSVNTDDIGYVPATSIDQLLQGRASGVQVTQNNGAPGSAMSVVIRGNTSVTGSSTPLYVIDGVALDVAGSDNMISPLASINTSDIESMEILKDASATAIYGSRGANGVVIVTTKSGKAGRTRVSYNYRMDVSEIANRIEVLNLSDFEIASNEYEVYTKNFSQAYNKATILENVKNEKYNTNWQDLIFQTAISNDHQLSISGGDENSTFALSAGYLKQNGIVVNSNFERFSFNSNMTRKLSKFAKVGAIMNYTKSSSDMAKQNMSGSPSNSIITGVLTYKPSDNPNELVTDEDNIYSSATNNPYAIAMNMKDNVTTTMLRSKFFLDVTPTKGLTFKSTISLTDSKALRKKYSPIGTNDNSNVDGNAQRMDNSMFTYSFEQLATYIKRSEALKSNINLVAGYSYQEWNQDNMSNTAWGFTNDATGADNLGIAQFIGVPNDTRLKWALQSFFGRANITTKNRYVFTLTGRYDGSSKLANQWSFFPSGAFAWRIDQEPFMKKYDWLSNFKLRAGYGMTGSQSIAALQTQTTLTTATVPNASDGSLQVGVVKGSLGNEDLSWETSYQANVGVDVGLFKNRLRLTVDAYHKLTKDLLISMNLPESSGYSSYFANGGEVRNMGVEFDLGVDVKRTKDFSWDVNFNTSISKNEILKLKGTDVIYGMSWLNAGNFPLNESINVAMPGESIGSFYGYRTDGIFMSESEIQNSCQKDAHIGQLKFVDLNKDGVIDASDRTILGKATPTLYSSLTNNINWKNWSLSFTITSSFNVERANMNNWILNHYGQSKVNLNLSKEAFDRRVKFDVVDPESGYIYQYSSLVVDEIGDQKFNDTLVEDASFIRLQMLRVGYKLPFYSQYFKNIRLFASVSNLFTITGYSGYDPESNISQNGLNQGGDLGIFPSSRTFSFGASIDF